MRMIPMPENEDKVILAPAPPDIPEAEGKIVIRAGDPPLFSYDEDSWQTYVEWGQDGESITDTLNVRWDGETKVWRDCE